MSTGPSATIYDPGLAGRNIPIRGDCETTTGRVVVQAWGRSWDNPPVRLYRVTTQEIFVPEEGENVTPVIAPSPAPSASGSGAVVAMAFGAGIIATVAFWPRIVSAMTAQQKPRVVRRR